MSPWISHWVNLTCAVDPPSASNSREVTRTMVTLLPSLWEWRVQLVLAQKPTWTDRITYTRRRNRRWLVLTTGAQYQADAIYIYPKLKIKYGARNLWCADGGLHSVCFLSKIPLTPETAAPMLIPVSYSPPGAAGTLSKPYTA